MRPARWGCALLVMLAAVGCTSHRRHFCRDERLGDQVEWMLVEPCEPGGKLRPSGSWVTATSVTTHLCGCPIAACVDHEVLVIEVLDPRVGAHYTLPSDRARAMYRMDRLSFFAPPETCVGEVSVAGYSAGRLELSVDLRLSGWTYRRDERVSTFDQPWSRNMRGTFAFGTEGHCRDQKARHLAPTKRWMTPEQARQMILGFLTTDFAEAYPRLIASLETLKESEMVSPEGQDVYLWGPWQVLRREQGIVYFLSDRFTMKATWGRGDYDTPVIDTDRSFDFQGPHRVTTKDP